MENLNNYLRIRGRFIASTLRDGWCLFYACSGSLKHEYGNVESFDHFMEIISHEFLMNRSIYQEFFPHLTIDQLQARAHRRGMGGQMPLQII